MSVGVDLGGTSLRVGLFDADLPDSGIALLDSRTIRTRVEDGPEAVISDVAECIEAMVAAYPSGSVVEGIGIGSPGPLNLVMGRLGKLPNFPGWDGYPLRDRLAAVTDLPVVLECDANAAAVAEWKLGAGRAGVDSMAMITLGTGVGSGLILHGKIWHGMVGMGGEVGHLCLDAKGPACGCGSRGCLEQYASANGLMRLAREAAESDYGTEALRALVGKAGGFTPLDVAKLAEEGDASARRAFETLGSWLGLGLAGLINTLDLPLIIIGGGVASAWELFADAMFARVRAYSYVYRLGEPTQRAEMEQDRTFIRPAELGPAAGLLGAALLPSLAKPRPMVEA